MAVRAPATRGPSSSNTFRLYVHRNGERLVGLCTELKEVIEGRSADEILVKAKALIESAPGFAGMKKPRISLRVALTPRRTSKVSRFFVSHT